MNIVFWLIVIIVLGLVWCLISGAFKSIGKLGTKAKDKVVNNIKKDDEVKENENISKENMEEKVND